MRFHSNYSGKNAYFGRVAASYETDRVEEPIWNLEQEWVARWASEVFPGARLLDIPVGTGRFVPVWLARKAEVSALDISEDMLEVVRRREFGRNPALLLEKGDAEALVHPDASFDFVVCWRLLHLVPDSVARKVLGELARVCRGRVVVQVFGVIMETRRLGRLRAWIRRWLPRGDSPESLPWGHIENYAHSEACLQRMFKECGLRLVFAETLAEYGGRPVRIYVLEHNGDRT
jgi:ubiquinone/menaquinone biosynthesis C-methylase UbiE